MLERNSLPYTDSHLSKNSHKAIFVPVDLASSCHNFGPSQMVATHFKSSSLTRSGASSCIQHQSCILLSWSEAAHWCIFMPSTPKKIPSYPSADA